MGLQNANDSTKESFFVQTFIGSGLRIPAVVSLPSFPRLSTEMSRSSSAYSVKIAQICFGLVFLGLVLFGLRSMMFGSNRNMGIILGLVFVSVVVLVLDERYWVFPAFCFGYYHEMPYIKFTGTELGALVLVTTFFIRQALHRDRLVSSRKVLVWTALPFLSWMCLVWLMNPTGMFIFGSSSIGGRFYFKVLLAFFSLFCLSSMRFGQKESKLLCVIVAFGYVANACWGVLRGGAQSAFGMEGAHYSLIPMTYVAPLFLCRFSFPDLISRFWPFVGFFFSFGLGFWSGNRTGGMRPVLVGVLAPFFLRKDRLKTFGLFICAAFALGILVGGHGSVWRLPFAVQRGLSFLPGKWDRRLENYGFQDNFRAVLREAARDHIRENPWFGDGGFSLDYGEMAWTNANRSQDSINMHILSRNWHNVWYGMAADFGIPLSVCWALFMAVLLSSGWKTVRRMPLGSWNQTACMYFYLLIVVEFFSFFFAGGHSARTAEQVFLWAGMMTAAANGAFLAGTVSYDRARIVDHSIAFGRYQA